MYLFVLNAYKLCGFAFFYAVNDPNPFNLSASVLMYIIKLINVESDQTFVIHVPAI